MESSIGEILYTDIVLLQAHVKKHQGAFNDAASILTNVTENYRSIPWLRSHFSIDILRMNELIQPSCDWTVLLDNLYLKWKHSKKNAKLEILTIISMKLITPLCASIKTNLIKV